MGTTTEGLAYFRISLDATGERLGVERQQPPTRALAERLGIEIADTYIDNDLSATSGVVRPEFERLLADLHAQPRPVFVWHLDRLLRLSSDLERVIATGVNVHAVEAGHLDLSTPAGRAVARTITAWAQYEGEQKSLRQKLALRQRSASGKSAWVRRPFGYERDGTLRKPESVELAKAYRQLVAGVSVSAIARDWNERGIQTSLGYAWTPVAVSDLLRHPRNAKIATHGGEEVGEGRWKAVVPLATFRAAQTIMTAPERAAGGGPRRHLLTGVARCDVCDSTLVAGSRKNRNGSEYKVYVCHNKHVSLKVEWLDRYIRQLVLNLLSTPEGAIAWEKGQSTDETEALVAEEVSLQARREAFFTSMTEGDLTPREYRSAVDRIEGRLDEVRAARRKAIMGSVAHGGGMLASDVVAGWDELEMDRQRTFIEALASRITVKRRVKGQRGLRDGDIEVVWRKP